MKSEHWKYEKEWRVIVELKHTIGTGLKDDKGQPINLVRIPNEAVKEVYYTERTPSSRVEEIKKRLGNPNNRFGVTNLTKLVLSETDYGYKEAEESHDKGIRDIEKQVFTGHLALPNIKELCYNLSRYIIPC